MRLLYHCTIAITSWRHHQAVGDDRCRMFLLPALLFPSVLHPLNKAWMHFGELLSKIVSPIALWLGLL